MQILQAQFHSSSFFYSDFLSSVGAHIIWGILSKEKPKHHYPKSSYAHLKTQSLF